MGQYYRAIVWDKDGHEHIMRSYDYESGAKLMEHSYLGNRFVGAVMSYLLEGPCEVAWVGDYSNEYVGDLYEEKKPFDQYIKVYKKVWNRSKTHYKEPTTNVSGLFLVNHTKRICIDLDDYYEQNKWLETFEDSESHELIDYWCCINPLPLLTACGNGRGGGDYYEEYPDYEEVGSWAFDRLELVAEKPSHYLTEMYCFKEKRA